MHARRSAGPDRSEQRFGVAEDALGIGIGQLESDEELRRHAPALARVVAAAAGTRAGVVGLTERREEVRLAPDAGEPTGVADVAGQELVVDDERTRVHVANRVDQAKAALGTDADGRIADPELRARIAKFEMDWRGFLLTTQRVTAYQGQTAVYSALASTGTWRTPTVVGTYQIYVKYRYTPMSGPGYYLPNVPHTMYFYRGYAIHGAYWHNNFGTPMSHGCVNLSLADAEWFYNWASVGTRVVSHY